MRAQRDESAPFSFSGIKGQVQQRVQQYVAEHGALSPQDTADIAWSFQEAVVEALASKVIFYAHMHHAQSLCIVGGVSANQRLRTVVQEHLEKEGETAIPILFPQQFVYCTDNAAMIGACGILLDYPDSFTGERIYAQ